MLFRSIHDQDGTRLRQDRCQTNPGPASLDAGPFRLPRKPEVRPWTNAMAIRRGVDGLPAIGSCSVILQWAFIQTIPQNVRLPRRHVRPSNPEP